VAVAVVLQQQQQIVDLAQALAVYLPQLQHLIPTQLIQVPLALVVRVLFLLQQAMVLKDQTHLLALSLLQQ
jgi:hypothetical protein